jgi:RimJ/RimL family protein N-acetyltransferase
MVVPKGVVRPCIFLVVGLAFPDPALTAEEIVLRRPAPGDVPWITAACSDRELSQHIPAMPYPYSQSDARTFIEGSDRGWAEGNRAGFVIAHAADGDGLGTIGLRLFADDAGLASVGYWLRREARGHGAATIAVQLVSAWAFDELGIKRLSLFTLSGNVASQRVAERAGFTREGILRAWVPTRDGRRDSVMFSLLPDDQNRKPSDP